MPKEINNSIIRLKSLLNMDLNQFSSLLGLNEAEIAEALILEKKDNSNRSSISSLKNEKKSLLENYLKSLERACSAFKYHHMVSVDIINELTYNFKFADNTEGSLIQLYRDDSSWKISSKLRNTIEEICKKYFTSYEIGELAPRTKILNKEICEKFLGKKVDVKYVTKYDEGGDYDFLQTQYESEVYDDGGSFWEKIPDFSTNMTDAWTIVEKLAKEGVQIRLSNKAMANNYWWCYADDQEESIIIQAETAEIAICEMAVKVSEQRMRSKS